MYGFELSSIQKINYFSGKSNKQTLTTHQQNFDLHEGKIKHNVAKLHIYTKVRIAASFKWYQASWNAVEPLPVPIIYTLKKCSLIYGKVLQFKNKVNG